MLFFIDFGQRGLELVDEPPIRLEDHLSLFSYGGNDLSSRVRMLHIVHNESFDPVKGILLQKGCDIQDPFRLGLEPSGVEGKVK
jgi:hypothetical protein